MKTYVPLNSEREKYKLFVNAYKTFSRKKSHNKIKCNKIQNINIIVSKFSKLETGSSYYNSGKLKHM